MELRPCWAASTFRSCSSKQRLSVDATPTDLGQVIKAELNPIFYDYALCHRIPVPPPLEAVHDVTSVQKPPLLNPKDIGLLVASLGLVAHIQQHHYPF